ncbi:hypothetical protein V6N13_054213 [Hibiscus sabdariffa]
MGRGRSVTVQDTGSVSSPNLSPSKTSLQASSPSNNDSSDEHGEAQDIPQNQDKHVEATSVHMDEVPIDDGRLISTIECEEERRRSKQSCINLKFFQRYLLP